MSSVGAVAVVLIGCARPQVRLHPTHIETPDYDRVAQLAHIEGSIVVKATIDADGNVTDAKPEGQPMLGRYAATNLRLWRFEKPKRAPFRESITYDYRFEGPGQCEALPAKVTFDLPDRVEVVAEPVHTCDPTAAIGKRRGTDGN